MAQPPISTTITSRSRTSARRPTSTLRPRGPATIPAPASGPITRSSLTPAAARSIVGQIDFASVRKAANSLDRLNFGNDKILGVMKEASSQPGNMALMLSKAILTRRVPRPEAEQAARTLVHWARGNANASRRRNICKAFLQLKGGVMLVQCIGELPKTDARAFMKDYFASTGNMKSVVRWLQLAGAVLRHSPRPIPGTDGFFDWVEETVSNVGSAIAETAGTIVDAVVNAGKSIGDALAEVVGWTLDKVADVIEALIEAGQTVAAILQQVAGKTFAVIKKTLRAMLRLTYTVADIIDEMAGLLPGPLKKVVRALVKISVQAADIIINFADRTLDAIQTALDALLAEGVRLMTVVRDICRHVAEEMRKGFFEGLIALGKTPLTLLKEAAKSGAAIALAAFSCLLEIWGGYRSLTASEKRDARRIFGWSIDLERVKITNDSVPADIANWLNNKRPFTTMYVLNFASDVNVEQARGTLIHELTHVWQAATIGPVYMVEALHSQFFGRGYNVTDADLKAAKGDLNKLQKEQQAVVVERYWRGRYNGESIDWRKYESLARQVYEPRFQRFMLDMPLSSVRRSAARASISASIR